MRHALLAIALPLLFATATCSKPSGSGTGGFSNHAFLCGDKSCQSASEICVSYYDEGYVGGGGSGVGPVYYECADMPAGCAHSKTCDCFDRYLVGDDPDLGYLSCRADVGDCCSRDATGAFRMMDLVLF